jgi:hypothetical protein
MPAAGYTKHTFTGRPPWENPEAVPFNDVPDLSRGEIRFAAEVLRAALEGDWPEYVILKRALEISAIMAYDVDVRARA